MQKNIAGQKWIVFAFDKTNNTPKTGDAANITANLRIDGGDANAVDDEHPTELEDGYYAFDTTQAETNGNYLLICPVSSTENIQVIGCPAAVWTDQTVSAGANEFAYIVKDGDGNPIAGVEVWITSDEAGTQIIWNGTTDANGQPLDSKGNKPWLDSGTIHIWKQKAGYIDDDWPDTEVVS